MGLDPLEVPPHVFALDSGRLMYARFNLDDGAYDLEAYEAVALEEGLFGVGPLGGPIHDLAPMRERIESMLGGISPALEAASLVLPDSWFRISFAELDKLPRRARERDEVLRWKLKNLVPFRVDELRLDATFLSSRQSESEAQPIMIGFAIDVLISQLEGLFAEAGVRLGQISNESLSLLSSVSDLLSDVELGAVVSVSDTSYALIFTLRGEPVLHRRKELGPMAEAGLDEGLVQKDLRLTRGFLESRLGSPRIGRFVLVGAQERAAEWVGWLESAFSYPVSVLENQHLGITGIPEDLPVHEVAPMLGAARQTIV